MGSDDEEEDGDDEEEVEKAGGAECKDRVGAEEDQMVVDVESGPTAAQEGRSVQEDCQPIEGMVCGTGSPGGEGKIKDKKETEDESSTDHPGQPEGKSEMLKEAENESSESVTVNTNKEDNTKEEEIQSSTEEKKDSNSQKLTETETDKCETVIESGVTAEEGEQHLSAEPMEFETTETSAGNEASAASKGEEDTGAGILTYHPLNPVIESEHLSL